MLAKVQETSKTPLFNQFLTTFNHFSTSFSKNKELCEHEEIRLKIFRTVHFIEDTFSTIFRNIFFVFWGFLLSKTVLLVLSVTCSVIFGPVGLMSVFSIILEEAYGSFSCMSFFPFHKKRPALVFSNCFWVYRKQFLNQNGQTFM